MAIKLRTNQNVLLRVPNDHLLKQAFVNLTRFPIRRLDVTLHLGFTDAADNIKIVLLELAAQMPLCLDSPQATVIFSDLYDSGMKLVFSVWVKNSSYYDLKNELLAQIQQELSAKNIELQYPCKQVINR